MGKIWCGTELEEYTVYQIPLCGVLSEHKGKTWKLFCHSLVMDCKTARKWGRGSIFKNFSLYRFLLVSQNLCCTSVFFAKFSYSFTFLRRFRALKGQCHENFYCLEKNPHGALITRLKVHFCRDIREIKDFTLCEFCRHEYSRWTKYVNYELRTR